MASFFFKVIWPYSIYENTISCRLKAAVDFASFNLGIKMGELAFLIENYYWCWPSLSSFFFNVSGHFFLSCRYRVAEVEWVQDDPPRMRAEVCVLLLYSYFSSSIFLYYCYYCYSFRKLIWLWGNLTENQWVDEPVANYFS